MSKKKILHIIQSLGNGGCENFLLRTLPLLADKFEHRIVTLRELGELAPRFVEKGISVTTIHHSGFFDISGYRKLLAETKRFNPDTIITYLFHADMIGRLFLQPALSFRTNRDCPRSVEGMRNPTPIIPFLRTTYNHPKYFIARLLEKITKHCVKQYLANSSAVKDFYVKKIGVQPEKITVIPNGIDTEYFDSILPDPNLRASLGVVPHDFVIICVANFHVNKGHQYLLEAFESLFPKFHHMKLLLVGDGSERKNLERQINAYQSKHSILFLGHRTEVPQLLKISDCFVLPTLFEGMSNALIEAMAAGLPVITTNIPENRELISHEESGVLIPPRNWKALSTVIEDMVSDVKKRKILAENARSHINRNFSLSHSALKFEKLLITL